MEETNELMRVLRDYGLYRDEHKDFCEEMQRLRVLRGKAKERWVMRMSPGQRTDDITINETTCHQNAFLHCLSLQTCVTSHLVNFLSLALIPAHDHVTV